MSAPTAIPADVPPLSTPPSMSLSTATTALVSGILALFLVATVGAWAWFHVNTPVREVIYEFQPRAELPGLRYKEVPISAQAAEMLANTNLINGTFTGPEGRDFTVFFGDWRARSAREMNVVQHTPDICWIGAGWTVVPTELPPEITLQFGTERIPFVCRVFQAPRSTHKELTLWCTLVGGQVFEEGERFASEDKTHLDRTQLQHNAARRRSYEQFLRAVQYRVPSDGSKQFVRFSTTFEPDGGKSLQALQRFGEQWIQVQRTRATTPPRP